MNRLVILAPNWLGDAVMALPAIADVRRAAPTASITVAARASVAPLYAVVREVDDTLVLGPDAARTIGGKAFDAALLLPNSIRAALVARRAGIPQRWGYRTECRGALLTRAIPPPVGLHQVEYYQRLVRELGFPNGPIEPSVMVSAGMREAGRSLLAASGWNGSTPLVALAPGAAYGSAKRWPPAYFAELVEGLAADGIQCVMIGSEADAGTASEIAKAVARLTLLDVVGRTDLSTLAGVLANCRGIVTNDSGAMHLAAAIGLTVTAMFGPTNELATAPRTANRTNLRPSRQPPSLPEGTEVGTEARITILTHPVWCRPCMLRECPLDHACMRGIGVATVLEVARSRL